MDQIIEQILNEWGLRASTIVTENITARELVEAILLGGSGRSNIFKLSTFKWKRVTTETFVDKPKDKNLRKFLLDNIKIKYCNWCFNYKKLEEFLLKDIHCKLCKKEYTQNNKKYIKERSAKYYLKNKEYFQEYNAKYYLKNKEYIQEYNAKYYLKNKEHIQEYNAKYYLDNLSKFAAKSAKYRTAKLSRTPSWSETKIIQEIYENRPEGYHIDHIIPLQGKLVSGLHVASNLQYLTVTENLKKSNHYEIGDTYVR